MSLENKVSNVEFIPELKIEDLVKIDQQGGSQGSCCVYCQTCKEVLYVSLNGCNGFHNEQVCKFAEQHSSELGNMDKELPDGDNHIVFIRG